MTHDLTLILMYTVPLKRNNIPLNITTVDGMLPWKDNWGIVSGRRDSIGSIDFKQRPQQLPLLNQYYGTLGSAAASPAGPMGLVQPGQTLTPPPSLTGSATNLSLTGE